MRIRTCGFILYYFLSSKIKHLKWKPLLNALCAVGIAALAMFLALQFTNLHLFVNYDPYQVKTAIFANAVFSIIFWEIVYQVKIRKSK